MKISQTKSEPLELAQTRMITAEGRVEKARMASRAAKRKRKEAKIAARRAKKRLRRAKEELTAARSALTKVEEKLERQKRRATSQRKRLVPIAGSKPRAPKRVIKEAHQTKTQDGDSPDTVRLPAGEPQSSNPIEAVQI